MQPEVSKRGRNETENYVYFCAEKAIPKAMTGCKIKEASEKNELLGEMREWVNQEIGKIVLIPFLKLYVMNFQFSENCF